MKPLTILNKKELDDWHFEHGVTQGHDVYSTKRKPPEGSTFDDGSLIQTHVNKAWVDAETGDSIEIIYEGDS